MKRFLVPLLTVVGLLSLVGCGGDENDGALVGTWRDPYSTTSVILRSDGTFEVTDPGVQEVHGLWATSSSRITLSKIFEVNYGPRPDVTGTYSLSGDTLILSVDTAGGGSMTLIRTRQGEALTTGAAHEQ